MKFGYYHYCAHMGDEFVLTHPEITRINYVRETMIFGRGGLFRPRLAVVLGGGLGVPGRGRVAALGVPVRRRLEPRRADRPRRRPFFAINGHLRQENDFGGNMTVRDRLAVARHAPATSSASACSTSTA